HPVTDHKTRIDLTALDALQQRPHVAHHVCLPRLERELLVHARTNRNVIDKARIHAWNRDGSTLATRAYALSQHLRAVHLDSQCLLGALRLKEKRVPTCFHAL